MSYEYAHVCTHMHMTKWNKDNLTTIYIIVATITHVSRKRRNFSLAVVQRQLNHISNIACNKRVLKIFILYANQNYQFLLVLFIFIRICITLWNCYHSSLVAKNTLATLDIYSEDISTITNRNDNSEWRTNYRSQRLPRECHSWTL